ncbi:MAG: hypothetical protein Q8R47_05655 [Nanoarchaeota archaeon]|nr:hypothetical protein [Nanoarchaeota archaeon]
MVKTQILVEGPDCSGKTTLVERLKNELHWDAKALHHLEGNQFKRYLREYALQEKIIFNRGHYSEIAYGKLWRGGNPFSEMEKNILDQLCHQNMIIIFACPPLEVLQQRYQQRNFPQQIKYEELGQVRENFCELMESTPHLLYQSCSYDELQSLIQNAARKIQ